MLSSEYRRRIMHEINETHILLAKAKESYENKIECLKMEIAENKELGNKVSANLAWVKYCNEGKMKVKGLERHLIKLNGMLNDAYTMEQVYNESV